MFCSNSLQNQNLGSLIILPEFFEVFKKIKIPKSDLCNLRTVSGSYYETFSSIYLKRFNKSLCFTIYKKHWKTMEQGKVSIGNKEGYEIKILPNDNLKEYLDCSGSYFHSILLILYEEGVSEPNEGLIQLDPIIRSLRPHISDITLHVYPLEQEVQSREPGESIGKFLKQFINLKVFNIKSSIKYVTYLNTQPILANLCSKIQVNLRVWDSGDNLCETILAKSSVFINICIYGLGDEISRFENLLNRYKAFIPARISFDISIKTTTVEEVIRLTKLCVENQKCIHDLKFTFYSQNILTIQDQTIIEKCLLKLSRIMNHLELSQISDIKLDLLREIPIWPKLTLLYIYGYEHKLDILKRCPKLDQIFLGVNWDSCIFHDKQNTEEENLQAYFGHLKKLKSISCITALGEKYKNIKAMLKQIVPDTEFKGVVSDWWPPYTVLK